jgi:hypothetical protein
MQQEAIKIRPALQHRPLKKFSTETTEGSAANEWGAISYIQIQDEDEKTAIPRQASHVPMGSKSPALLFSNLWCGQAKLRPHGISKNDEMQNLFGRGSRKSTIAVGMNLSLRRGQSAVWSITFLQRSRSIPRSCRPGYPDKV